MKEVKRISICNVPVDSLTMDETVALINQSIKKKENLHHVVVNAAKLVNAQKDPELKASIVECDIINADGQSIVWAARFLKEYLPERVAGIDLMDNLVGLAAKENYKIFFLGAKEDVVNKVVDIYSNKYNKDIIAGYRNGYFGKDEELEIAKQIKASNADILFVAMSSPKKEIFLNKYKEVMDVPFIMGVGGSFDVVSGKVKRAPVWMQNICLEWFYRTMQEPGRMWKRYLTTNVAFVKLLLTERLSPSNRRKT
ncbi:WecB/TagA/CpsF family glycosyltransferase [Cyclobacterium amurskyense]|jgi:N-acetylglucosaminyldiphosphoundecaprenol N-acetyl-beta-D-mannosaminyltransferase|uniref:Glycosyl transferase, WecB/TagA/CpsF family n=1 Tax=Cyclobacterium amurskyense TaxID=320787 RepID=A0A0H4PBF1_9BACT|nr:WecB/TagA/CpsF family glycosyltransferase [Cyclobacterium amurskyense]AKP50113.1 Glycosyl transferase, WecB/TagA/CpsF family [Cyclobacterium amurskyense]|tara:strand:- start:3531 stop:4292 length:762 start_codon:yes stop_codon:yes gene_type:complete